MWGSDETPQQIVEMYTPITKDFCAKHPYQSIDELKEIIRRHIGQGFLGDKPLEWLAVLNRTTYKLVKRVYETAGNDSAINKEVGRELARLGGMPVMQVSETVLWLAGTLYYASCGAISGLASARHLFFWPSLLRHDMVP